MTCRLWQVSETSAETQSKWGMMVSDRHVWDHDNSTLLPLTAQVLYVPATQPTMNMQNEKLRQRAKDVMCTGEAYFSLLCTSFYLLDRTFQNTIKPISESNLKQKNSSSLILYQKQIERLMCSVYNVSTMIPCQHTDTAWNTCLLTDIHRNQSFRKPENALTRRAAPDKQLVSQRDVGSHGHEV